MISSRLILGVNGRPLTLILFPSAKGRGDPDSWQARRLPYNMF